MLLQTLQASEQDSVRIQNLYGLAQIYFKYPTYSEAIKSPEFAQEITKRFYNGFEVFTTENDRLNIPRPY